MKKIKYNLLIGLLLLESSIGLSAQTEDNNEGSVAQLDLYRQEAFTFDRSDASALALGQWKSYSTSMWVSITKTGLFIVRSNPPRLAITCSLLKEHLKWGNTE